MTDTQTWLTEMVKSTLEKKAFLDGVTANFLVEYLAYSNVSPEWARIPDNTKRSLILKELRKLERKLLAYKVEDVKGDIWFWRID